MKATRFPFKWKKLAKSSSLGEHKTFANSLKSVRRLSTRKNANLITVVLVSFDGNQLMLTISKYYQKNAAKAFEKQIQETVLG